MAVWETTVVTGAIWQRGNLHHGEGKIVKIDDTKDSQTTFEVNESVTLTFQAGNTVTGTFLGTLTVDGVAYPVVEWGIFRYAVGLDQSTSGVPTTLADTDITASTFTVCFFPGTLIAMLGGEIEVEKLATGDLVQVGDSRFVPVKWIGRQTASMFFGAAERLMPIRFAAGSLGGGGGGAAPSAA